VELSVASGRVLRRRIKSITSTAQITKAMQMVAASKMRKAQEAAIEARPFIRLLYRIQRKAVTRVVDFTHPLLEVRPVKKALVILVASDKGLCGALNSNLFRLAGRYNPHSTVFITAGRKAAQFVARTRRTLVADFPYADTPRFAEARAIVTMARDLFLTGEVDEVILLSSRFVNTLTQQAVALEFLPVGEIKGLRIPGAEDEAVLARDATQFKFEPNVEFILSYLLERYLNVLLYILLLNARASEQSARMVSMKNATDNAQSMIKDLTLQYNKLRQSAITQELLEIAGGQAN
jgi:F-type H+-transporting ATPase subunit gamma